MIKGVNKKIIEINNPGSIYFEKVVLYLKPDMGMVPRGILTAETRDMIQRLVPDPGAELIRRRFRRIMPVLFAGVSGAVVSAVVILLAGA